MSVNSDRLALYLAAEKDILLLGQSTRMGDRQMGMAELEQIRAEIARLSLLVARENGVGGGFKAADLSGSLPCR